MYKKIFVFALAIFSLTACLPDPVDSDLTKLNKEQAKIIEDYIQKNNLNATRQDLYNFNGDAFPVYTMIETEGVGKGTFIGNEAIWISYTIRDIQNRVIDTATESDSVIIYPGGYAKNIMGLSWCADMFLGNGGKGSFIIPSTLGYGIYPPPGFESNAVLILDMEVINRYDEAGQIDWFIEKNNLGEMQTTGTGLRFKKLTEIPLDTNAIISMKVKYTGKFMNGVIFDSNANTDGTLFDINNVIPGFAEALQMMNTGEKAVAILPSHIAYGENGSPSSGMPPRMALYFEMELVP